MKLLVALFVFLLALPAQAQSYALAAEAPVVVTAYAEWTARAQALHAAAQGDVMAATLMHYMVALAEDDATTLISAFPNPAFEDVSVSFRLERSQRAVIEVFDLLGRALQRHELGALAAGDHVHRLDVRGLTPGLYVIRLSGDAGARATVRMTRAMGA